MTVLALSLLLLAGAWWATGTPTTHKKAPRCVNSRGHDQPRQEELMHDMMTHATDERVNPPRLRKRNRRQYSQDQPVTLRSLARSVRAAKRRSLAETARAGR